MSMLKLLLCISLLAPFAAYASDTPEHPVKFRVVAIAEAGTGSHNDFVEAAKLQLQQLAEQMQSPHRQLVLAQRSHEERSHEFVLEKNLQTTTLPQDDEP